MCNIITLHNKALNATLKLWLYIFKPYRLCMSQTRRGNTMTYLKIIVPAIILTGCSVGSNNYGHQNHDSTYGQHHSSAYEQPCHQSACISSYSVSESYDSNVSQHYDAQTYQDHPYHVGTYQEQSYGAPQQPSPHAYGSQVVHQSGHHGTYHGGHSNSHHGGHNAYGHTPQLRGPYGQPKRGYKYGTLGASKYDLDADIYGIQGRLGYQSASFWGAELEGFAGLTDEEDIIDTVSVEAGVDYTLGAFGVLRSNLSPRWSVHSRAGYHFTDISGQVSSGDLTADVDLDTQDGFAYGIGTEYALSERDFIRADYTRYDQDLGKNDSLSIAYGRKF